MVPEEVGVADLSEGQRPKILNVSADFPDPYDPAKTRVIRTLMELSAGRLDNRVVSLNRSTPGAQDLARALLSGSLPTDRAAFDWGVALRYHAPGRGLFHKTFLDRLGDRIGDEVLAEAWRPDLLIGHKLTVEGIAVLHLAERLGLPFAITVQGDTDTKILSVRRDLAPTFRRVYHNAKLVTFFAPWTHEAVEARLGKRRGPVAIIPCPTEIDEPVAPSPGGDGLVSVFHLKSHVRKNLSAMAEALRLIANESGEAKLAICGGGSPADMAAAKASAGDAPGLVFEGPLDRAQVAGRLNAATGFVLPSRRETFGLVFIEALFAGVPIIYPAGQAVSGYFADCPFAIAVPPDDPKALAAAMRRLIDEETELKAALRAWQASPAARQFRRPDIAHAYETGILQTLSVTAP